jgi:predicted  nucleic acid-binding Zn-ribbon protein
MSQIDVLYRLQQIDTEIRDKKKRLGDVLRAQKESEALLAAKARATAAAAEHKKWQTKQQNLNLEIGTIANKVKVEEERLYSGKVKNTKEMGDMQKEIEALGRRRAALEDDLIEVMLMLEETQGEQKAAEAELQRVQTEWEAAQGQLRKEQHTVALRLNELNGQRQQQLPLVTAAALAEYDKVGQKKAGPAVATLDNNGRCLGCQLTVSAQLVKAAREGQLVHCTSCGRILYAR